MLKTRQLLNVTSLGLLLCTLTVLGDEQDVREKNATQTHQLNELISQLGSSEFAIREAATARLTQAGALAFDALDAAKNSDDPEVRLRAQLIEQKIVSHAASELEKVCKKIGSSFLLDERPVPRRLYLNSKLVGDAELVHAGCLRSLEILELRGSQITDDGLRQLRYLTNLRGLALENTKITDVGLQHLMELNQLVAIKLRGSSISDKGLKLTAKLPNLQGLSISGSQITDD